MCVRSRIRQHEPGTCYVWTDPGCGPVPIRCDNQGAIKSITSAIVKQKPKHIDVKYHQVQDEQAKGSIQFRYVTSTTNPANLLIKLLAVP